MIDPLRTEYQRAMAKASMNLIGADYETIALYVQELEKHIHHLERELLVATETVKEAPTLHVRFVGEKPVDMDVTKGGGWRECYIVPK
jgi:hypothetical protein